VVEVTNVVLVGVGVVVVVTEGVKPMGPMGSETLVGCEFPDAAEDEGGGATEPVSPGLTGPLPGYVSLWSSWYGLF